MSRPMAGTTTWLSVSMLAAILLATPVSPINDFGVYYAAGNGRFDVEAHNGLGWLYAWPLQYLFVWCRWMEYVDAELVWRGLLLGSMVGTFLKIGRSWYGLAILAIASKGFALTWQFANIAPVLVFLCLSQYGAIVATAIKPYFGLAVLFHALRRAKALGMGKGWKLGHADRGVHAGGVQPSLLTRFKNCCGVAAIRDRRRARRESLAWRAYTKHRR